MCRMRIGASLDARTSEDWRDFDPAYSVVEPADGDTVARKLEWVR